MVSISRSLRRRSLRNVPCAGSACHGGIARVLTFCLMAPAQGRASPYDSNDIGATSPGRWQLAHLLNMIGATSRLNVGALEPVAAGPWDCAWPMATTASEAASPTRRALSFIVRSLLPPEGGSYGSPKASNTFPGRPPNAP